MLPTYTKQADVAAGTTSNPLLPQPQPFSSSSSSSSVDMHGTYPPDRINAVATSTMSIDSLQSRLFGPRGITACTVQTQTPFRGQDDTARDSIATPKPARQGVKQARWSTWEFRLYALVFLAIVPLMCWVPIRLSLESARNYPQYSHHLERGWLFGRMRDDSDFQYKSFRDYVPLLGVVMVVYLSLSKWSERWAGSSAYQSLAVQVVRPNRVTFLSLFTAAFVITLHGFNVLKLLFVCGVNFALVRILGGTSIATPVIWAWNVGVLFGVHYYEGFSYAGSFGSSLAWMDSYPGLLPRWQINFNITMLRLVSFGLDFHWARNAADAGSTLSTADASATPPTLDARKRSEAPLALRDYSMHNYLLYALYPPLFIAGPIMTFNDFCKQLYNPLPISGRFTSLYAIRWVFSFLSMEFILHFMYVNAIKDSKAWRGASPMELSMIGFWNLIVVWLKLLIPWRFFRLWALADGVDAPENMVRCMANNYSTLGFWRSWHRSYNLWIVRYIYVPVGGSKNVIPATLLVFTFVALWHDLSLKLLTWGWLVTLFILPEVLARRSFTAQKFGDQWWYRHLCAAGGVVNVLMMMSANLVGFAIGTDGMAYMWQQLLSNWDGLTFMISACAVLFVGVQVMFEYREEELRRGIDRKC